MRELSGEFEVRNPVDSTLIYNARNYASGTGAFATLRLSIPEVLLRVYATEEVIENGRFIGFRPSEEYAAEWIIVDVTEPEVCVPPVKLGRPKRMTKRLDEVTVTASRVMFYNKGDTLIYNADAFVLAEGSMLDGLLEQMPGVELGRNGVITVNGKRIDSLLLNGKDLFNGNRELMLENLSAYAIKDVAVYEKLGRKSELMGENVGDSKRVMDVRLKREYSNGWIVNANAGYGSHSRYLAKLFGMWFSDNVSLSLYANSNNLSDYHKPGQGDSAWSGDMMGDGVVNRQMGGLLYNAQGYAGRWELQGELTGSHEEENVVRSVNVSNYLPTSDYYEYSLMSSIAKSWRFKTNHSAYFRFGENVRLQIDPEFEYQRQSDWRSMSAVTLWSALPSTKGLFVDAIYENVDSIQDRLISAQKQDSHISGNYCRVKLSAESSVKLHSSGQKGLLDLAGYVAGNGQTSERVTDRNIVNDGISRRYVQLNDDETRGINGHAMLKYTLFTNWSNKSQFNVSYGFNHSDQKIHSPFYQNVEHITQGMMLPSYRENQMEIDLLNSYDDRQFEKDHTVGIGWKADVNIGNLNKLNSTQINVGVNATASLTLSDRSYRYSQYANEQSLSYDRFSFLPDIKINLTIYSIRKRGDVINPNGWMSNLSLYLFPSKVPMQAMVSRPVTNPLRIMLGNPDLKDGNLLSLSFTTNKSQSDKLMHTIGLSYDEKINGLATAVALNPVSGVQTYCNYNIDGNRTAQARYQCDFMFGGNKKFSIASNTEGSYYRSTDFVGLQLLENLSKRKVDGISVSEMLKFNWKTGRHRVSAHAEGRVNRYFSSDAGFTDFTSWMCKYGATAVLNLPKNWGVSTDLTLYTRRGFADSRLNTTDLVWNARLTKSILSGSLVFVADGYDLLHQLSNIAYTVNAQARTETVSNVIPSYVLVHVQWRFNKQPKR